MEDNNKTLGLIINNATNSDDCIWEIGKLKLRKKIKDTWGSMLDLMNEKFRPNDDDVKYTLDTLRKRFSNMKQNVVNLDLKVYEDQSYTQAIKESSIDLYKKRILLKDQRYQFNSDIRKEARKLGVMTALIDAIKTYKPILIPNLKTNKTDKSIYVLLSDIHFGQYFDNVAGKYNKLIARQRLMNYADEIINTAKTNGINTCYVSMLGDLISGTIHNTQRSLNEMKVTLQIVGASMLISDFLYKLAGTFKDIYVNEVSGNHSRLDPNSNNCTRDERLDSIIYFICKKTLSKCNIHFSEDELDSTMCLFVIYGKRYIGVHGDWDKKTLDAVGLIEKMIDKNIDYLLSGHFHHIEAEFNNSKRIMCGCLSGGGDDFAMKRRLYSPASQLYMIVSKRGIESIHPVVFERRGGDVDGTN